jgi:hypothetical protein
MKPDQLSSVARQDGQQHVRDSGTVRLVGDVAGEPPASESSGVVDPEQTTTIQTRKAPWWRRPSPWWFVILVLFLIFYSLFLRLLAVVPFTSMAASAKIAPRLEIYTALACSVHKPDIAGQEFGLHLLSGAPTITCGSDPVVQAAVAKLIAGLPLCPCMTTSGLHPL